MSHATITGRLVADAALKYTPSGLACLELTVADNHRKKSGDEWSDDGTTFWRVTLWRDDAEVYAEKLLKGVEVIVNGEPRVREFEARDGTKGKSAEIHRAIVGIQHRQKRQQQTTPADDPWVSR